MRNVREGGVGRLYAFGEAGVLVEARRTCIRYHNTVLLNPTSSSSDGCIRYHTSIWHMVVVPWSHHQTTDWSHHQTTETHHDAEVADPLWREVRHAEATSHKPEILLSSIASCAACVRCSLLHVLGSMPLRCCKAAGDARLLLWRHRHSHWQAF